MKKIALLALILIAFALRVYRLDAQDLWGDEAFSIFLSQMPLDQVIAGAADTHPPFYPFLLFVWLRLVGSTAFATRALSAFAGVLIIPLIFVFVKRSSASSRVAHANNAGSTTWFSAILATVSPLLIYYSQETRMYELVTVLSLASVYFCLRTVEAHGPLRSASENFNRASLRGAYFVTTFLSIYTHYSAFYALTAQNIFALVQLRKNRARLTRWIGLQAALVAAYVPWIIVQASFLSGKASARGDEFGWRGVEMIFGKTFLAFSIGLTADAPLAQIAGAMFLATAAIGVYAIVQNRRKALVPASLDLGDERKRTSEISGWIAPIYFLIPLLIAFLVNPILPFFFERYVLVALPGFYVTMAFGLDYLARFEFRAAVGLIALFVAISLFSLTHYYFDDTYAKGKYGQMMAYVASHAQAGDALVLNNPLQKPLYGYYAPRKLPAFFLPDGTPLEDPRARAQLEQIARTQSRIWLVMFGNPAEYDPTDYLKRWLGANAFKSFFRGFVDADLTLYEMPRAPVVSKSVNAALGDHIKLTAFDLDRAEISPGQILQLTLHWQANARIAKPYVVFAHLIGGTNPATKSPVWAQLDNEPVGGSRATTTWKIGEVIDDRYGLQVPDNTPPGEYLIEVGMYDPGTLARLQVVDEKGNRVAEDRVLLGAVRVVSK